MLLAHRSCSRFFNGKRSFGSVRSPTRFPGDISKVVDKWIVQKLDNFNENDSRTWWNVCVILIELNKCVNYRSLNRIAIFR